MAVLYIQHDSAYRVNSMKIQENDPHHLHKYIGKPYIPRDNGIFNVDKHHYVKILSIEKDKVQYIYVHTELGKTHCMVGDAESNCPLIRDTFSQTHTSFFSYVDWREEEDEDATT